MKFLLLLTSFLATATTKAQKRTDIEMLNEIFRRFENTYKDHQSVIKNNMLYTQNDMVYASVTPTRSITSVEFRKENRSGLTRFLIYINASWKMGSRWEMGNQKGDFSFNGSNYRYTGDLRESVFIDMTHQPEEVGRGTAELLKKIVGLSYGDYTAAAEALKKEEPKPVVVIKPTLSRDLVLGSWDLAEVETIYGKISVDSLKQFGFDRVEIIFAKKGEYIFKTGNEESKGTYSVDVDGGKVLLTEAVGETKTEMEYKEKNVLSIYTESSGTTLFFKKRI